MAGTMSSTSLVVAAASAIYSALQKMPSEADPLEEVRDEDEDAVDDEGDDAVEENGADKGDEGNEAGGANEGKVTKLGIDMYMARTMNWELTMEMVLTMKMVLTVEMRLLMKAKGFAKKRISQMRRVLTMDTAKDITMRRIGVRIQIISTRDTLGTSEVADEWRRRLFRHCRLSLRHVRHDSRKDVGKDKDCNLLPK